MEILDSGDQRLNAAAYMEALGTISYKTRCPRHPCRAKDVTKDVQKTHALPNCSWRPGRILWGISVSSAHPN